MYNKFNLPSVAIIVLNWNGKEDTLECLASLKNIDYGNFQIIVVDNGSEDGSVTTISKHFPEVILLENCANLGYAGGNNTGIKWAIDHNIDNILILNNDTIVAPNILTAFLNAADVLPDESVLGAKIYYYDKPDTIWFAGGQWINYSKGFIHLGSDQIDSPEFNSPNNVDYITGCALFASAKIFKKVGLFNEDFFLTYEETDWCYRAKAIGYSCLVIPEAKLWHKVSASFGGCSSPIISYFYSRNKPLWAQKNLGMSHISLFKENIYLLSQLFFPPFYWLTEITPFPRRAHISVITWIKAIYWNFYNRKYHILATLIGLKDFYLGRFGNCPKAVHLLHRHKLKT